MAFEKGNKLGKGRPSKVEEQKVNEIFLNALKRLYKKDDDDEAKISFVTELAGSQRGQIFIAEHLFGKPKDIIDVTTDGEKLQTIINLGTGLKPKD